MTSGRGERGSVTAFVASVTVALLAVAGLVVDGGLTLAARRRAFNEAESAARAGAQGLDEAALRRGEVRLDPSRARALASHFMNESGLDGLVTIAGDVVTVEVDTEQHMTILGIVGVGDLALHARASATAAEGIQEERPGT